MSSFFEIVSGLKVANIRKKYTADNIAWILNCVPLPSDHADILQNELNALSSQFDIKVTTKDNFFYVH
jgi:hypothetical protein